MTFHVGQKVVCVDGSTNGDPGTFPREREVYTIKWVGVFSHPYFNDEELSVHLVEINRPKNSETGLVIPYRASRFRPVQTKSTETGMAILRGLLDTSPVSLNEEVG